MRDINFSEVRSRIRYELDRITTDVANSLDVDLVVFSVNRNEQLETLPLEHSYRSVSKRDNVCEACLSDLGRVDVDSPVVIPQASLHSEDHAGRPGGSTAVAGYIGVPVSSDEIGSIGAIRGITSKPRRWSDIDLSYLKAVSVSVEHLVMREKYRLESADASRLASDYDQIISAFSQVRAAAVSIHDAFGRLVFATKALTGIADEQEIERPFTSGSVRLREGTQIGIRLGLGADLAATIEQTQSGYFICHWMPERRSLN